MNAEIERIREDRVTFRFDDDDAPVIELANWGRPYMARVRSIRARFDADTGALLSVDPHGKKIKKDGEDSKVSAYFGWDFDRLDADVIQWAHEAGIDARERARDESDDPVFL